MGDFFGCLFRTVFLLLAAFVLFVFIISMVYFFTGDPPPTVQTLAENSSTASRTSAPSPTPRPVATRSLSGKSLESAISPSGTVLAPDGIAISIEGANYNGNGFVASANRFNRPPRVGYHYVIVSAALENRGKQPKTFTGLEFYLVGDRRIVYEALYTLVVQDDVIGVELFNGGMMVGNLVFEVPMGESGFVLMYQENIVDKSNRVFIRLPAE